MRVNKCGIDESKRDKKSNLFMREWGIKMNRGGR